MYSKRKLVKPNEKFTVENALKFIEEESSDDGNISDDSDTDLTYDRKQDHDTPDTSHGDSDDTRHCSNLQNYATKQRNGGHVSTPNFSSTPNSHAVLSQQVTINDRNQDSFQLSMQEQEIVMSPQSKDARASRKRRQKMSKAEKLINDKNKNIHYYLR